MARDESVYPESEKFYPERFLKSGKLNPNVRDPMSFMLGFGRRYVLSRFSPRATRIAHTRAPSGNALGCTSPRRRFSSPLRRSYMCSPSAHRSVQTARPCR